MDLGLFKTLCFSLHVLSPSALQQRQDLCLFKSKYHLLAMSLITFREVSSLKTSHYVHEKKGFDSLIQEIQKSQFLLKWT